MGITKTDKHTLAEYATFENAAETKHEYENGKILAMSGGTLIHAIIGSAIGSEISRSIEAKKLTCKTLSSDARVYIESIGAIVYPDASVFCGKPEMSTIDKNAITNPVLVVEVLSKSTESYDRSGKFSKYRQLDSFREYVLISQDEPVVESYYREENDTWRITRIEGLDQTITFASLGLEISLARLYRDVDFVDEEEQSGTRSK